MTIKDIFNTMLTTTGESSLQSNVIALLFAMLIGIYLFVVYKLFVRKTLYNININITLVGMTIVTAAIILAIQSNLVLSLGMVGALSIVRYRAAIKDPMDLFFLFWAVAAGIMCGANLFLLAWIVSIILTILVFVLGQIPTMKAPYIMVINGKHEGLEDALTEVLEGYAKHYKIKSRSIAGDAEKMIVELKVSDEQGLIEAVSGLKEVERVSLLTYEGDVVG